MSFGGREWLWRNEHVPYRTPVDGASYVETADTGGFDECFPTIAPCQVPANVPGFSGLALPDHGELWAVRPAIEVSTPDEGGAMARTVWTGRRMPYRFTRTVRVTSAGLVEMHYALRNEGSARMPFIWAAHPLLPLTPKTRIVIAQGTRIRVGAQQGIDIGGIGSMHEWPRVKSGEKTVDLSFPDTVAKKYVVKLFLEPGEGRVGIEEEGARLELSYDARTIPDLGLWINRRAWSGAPKRPAGLTLGIEPAMGAPDSLADALGSWNRAHWLDAGETREWSLSWRGST